MRICVHEDQLITGRRQRAAIAGAGNLLDRFEDHDGPGCAGDVCGVIGGHSMNSTSQSCSVKALAAVLISTRLVLSKHSSLKAGMTMEIFTG